MRIAVVQWIMNWRQQSSRTEVIYPLIYVLILLVLIGIATIESASYPLTSGPTGSGAFYYCLSHLAGVAVAGVFVILFQFCPLWLVPWVGAVLFGVNLILMGVAAATGGYQGNRSWTPPPLVFQPSEIAKVGFVILAAWLLSRKQPKTFTQREVLVFFGLTLAMTVMLGLQHDMGMLIVFFLITIAMLFLSGFPLHRWAVVVAVGGVLAVGGIIMEDYRVSRIKAWFAPKEYLDGPGYHIMNSLIAISRGGVRGLGIGRSPDKWGSLPYPHTDSVFCVLAAETGLWGTALLLGAFGALAVLSFMAALRATSRMEWLLAIGCGLMLCLQAAVQMAVATNLLPPAGLTLPFISYGRSSLLASMLAAGVVLWVVRRGKPTPVLSELD
ncbi:MAG: FtsW/RodA/SpoVE family cell cycle protein [Armatimonadota bacterium]